MKKHVLSLLLTLILVFTALPMTTLAAGSQSNFKKANTYNVGQFSDVSNEWFAPYVQACYEYGLMSGTTPNAFEPSKNLTIAEAIKLAACLHSIFNSNAIMPINADRVPWYGAYVNYALEKGIIKETFPNYDVFATRSDMAVIFAAALPDEALKPINVLGNDFIPDVSKNFSYGPAVYKLYGAGVLTGSDSAGTFYPNNTITRDAVAAIVARMAEPGLRQTLSLKAKELPATELAFKCSAAVFRIDWYDKTGLLCGMGSGFFIDSSGLAVTSYNVIKDASTAKIWLTNGKSYNVSGIYDYDEITGLALIQIAGSDFTSLELGSSEGMVTGTEVYAAGFSLVDAQTLTKGLITNATFTMNGSNFFVFNSKIADISTGGVIIDSSGCAVGMIYGYFSDGQEINIAVPINKLSSLSTGTYTPLTKLNPLSDNQVSASSQEIVITKGSTNALAIYYSTPDNKVWLYHNAHDESIVQGKWGNQSGPTNYVLYLTGLKAGTTTVEVTIFDKSITDESAVYLAITYITVTVIDNTPSVKPYAGFSPIIDFGACFNVPVYKTVSTNTGTAFYYKFDDIQTSPDEFINNYCDFLTSVGCIYLESFETDSGTPMLVYDYAPQKWNIYFGFDYINDVPCVAVCIIPY